MSCTFEGLNRQLKDNSWWCLKSFFFVSIYSQFSHRNQRLDHLFRVQRQFSVRLNDKKAVSNIFDVWWEPTLCLVSFEHWHWVDRCDQPIPLQLLNPFNYWSREQRHGAVWVELLAFHSTVLWDMGTENIAAWPARDPLVLHVCLTLVWRHIHRRLGLTQ